MGVDKNVAYILSQMINFFLSWKDQIPSTNTTLGILLFKTKQIENLFPNNNFGQNNAKLFVN